MLAPSKIFRHLHKKVRLLLDLASFFRRLSKSLKVFVTSFSYLIKDIDGNFVVEYHEIFNLLHKQVPLEQISTSLSVATRSHVLYSIVCKNVDQFVESNRLTLLKQEHG